MTIDLIEFFGSKRGTCFTTKYLSHTCVCLQVKSGTIFDNILITDDESFAEEVGAETWGKTKDGEKKMKDAQDEEERKQREAEAEEEGDDEEEDFDEDLDMGDLPDEDFEDEEELHDEL